MTVIGELAVNAVVRTEGVTRGSRAYRTELSRMAEEARGKFAAGMGAAAVAVGTATYKLGQFTAQQSVFAANLSQQSQRLGTSVEQLSRYQHAADAAANVTGDGMANALQRMNTNASQAATGGGRAAKAFEELGLSASHLATLPLDTRLSLIADAIAKVDDRAAQVRLSEKIFGDGDLVPLLDKGAAGIRELTAESDRLGTTMNGKTNAALVEANDGFSRLSKVWTGLKQDAGGAMSGFFNYMANDLANNLNAMRPALDAQEQMKQAAKERAAAEAKLANAIQARHERDRAASQTAANAAAKRAKDAAEFNNRVFDKMGGGRIKDQLDETRFGNKTFGMSESDAARERLGEMKGNLPVNERVRGLQRELIAELETREKLEAQKKKDLETKQREKQLDGEAAGLIEQNRTAQERLAVELEKIDRLKSRGLLTAEQAMRASQAAGKEFKDDVTSKGLERKSNALVRFGSSDAHKAIRESREANEPLKKLSEKQLEELKKGNDLTAQMLTKFEGEATLASWN